MSSCLKRCRKPHVLVAFRERNIDAICSMKRTLLSSSHLHCRKPDPQSSREEKESWIRAKYDRCEFLPPLPYPEAPLQQQLIDAIARQDTRQVILCLARATPETVNAAYSRHDPRAAIHIAATLGHIVYLQLLLWVRCSTSIFLAGQFRKH